MKKYWREKKPDNPWSIFKIIGEFVKGYERMSELGPCISIFGSARTEMGSPHYKLAIDVAKKIGQSGYGIITGGGPGIMEAANKGAKMTGVASIGLNIDLPYEQKHNEYIDNDKLINFHYFFARKVMFIRYTQAVVVLPGGLGTMDELFEILTLVQTKKTKKIPIILVETEFWTPLIEWLEKSMLKRYNYISDTCLKILSLVDTPEEVIQIINTFHKKQHFYYPNF